MTRYVCIHGHFYQPPRESPWTDKIEIQPSAAPFPNWNHRITFECYDANTRAAILHKEGSVSQRINNYSYISYNFGPTLLRWMKKHSPQTHDALIAADKESVKRFGYGTALAQVFHHAILPLCNARDKHTEIKWGIADFVHRYGRIPQGMWLAETAADIPTLEALAANGILFTLLAPEQCKAVRPLDWKEWRDGNNVDTTQPYLIRLPSGSEITVFFYHGDLAQDVAFRGALNNGERFGKRIIAQAKKSPEGSLTHYATDGESYGHHHRYGEMALAYCLKTIIDEPDIVISNFASYLSTHPPVSEAQLHEPSAWSCAHGVGRWSENCGCVIDPRNTGKQEWRKTLRSALNWLRDQLASVYEQSMSSMFSDPWLIRDGYQQALLNNTVSAWLDSNAKRVLLDEEKETAKSLLEIQTYALQMFTSCGWFFDDAGGLEPVQILRYAARAIEKHNDLTNNNLEPAFVKRLASMKSLNSAYPTGLDIWKDLVLQKGEEPR